jgi:Na+-transporting NADH:ubiquinone oxidoreductase subunit NqrF
MWFYVLLAVGIFTVVFVPIIACIVLAMLVVYLIFDDKFIKTHPVQCKIAKKEFLRSARDMVRIGEVLAFLA